jgi:hypothetical protein
MIRNEIDSTKIINLLPLRKFHRQRITFYQKEAISSRKASIGSWLTITKGTALPFRSPMAHSKFL